MLLLWFLAWPRGALTMVPTRLIGPNEAAQLGCWSADQRYYEWRKAWILSVAQRVFGRRALATRWMSDRALGLGWNSPCALLVSHSGFEQVVDFLLRIEYGVYW
ncbi:antitoxin Xre/MbcA/ParS toxin-binding domain-containing protein [Pseudomonas pudica]